VSTPTRSHSALSSGVRAFLVDRVRYATIATLNDDGSPHQVVIWFLVRETHGDAVLVANSRRGRRWPTNLERDARASLAVHEAEDAVTIDCEVMAAYDGERAQADIAEMARRYDTPAAAEREIARFRTEDRITFVLRPTKIHVHGDPH
jgi:hypothetical protein